MNNLENTIREIQQADLYGLKHIDGSFYHITGKSQNQIQGNRSEFLRNLRLDICDLLFDKLGIKFQVQFRDEHRDQFGKYYDRIRITWRKPLDHGFILNPSELLNC